MVLSSPPRFVQSLACRQARTILQLRDKSIQLANTVKNTVKRVQQLEAEIRQIKTGLGVVYEDVLLAGASVGSVVGAGASGGALTGAGDPAGSGPAGPVVAGAGAVPSGAGVAVAGAVAGKI